jgi:hypothetical protein
MQTNEARNLAKNPNTPPATLELLAQFEEWHVRYLVGLLEVMKS